MRTIRQVTRAKAQIIRIPKGLDSLRQRMNRFDGYARGLLEKPDKVDGNEGIEENVNWFALALRGAFKRAGITVQMRKERGLIEIRAWVSEEPNNRRNELVRPNRTGLVREEPVSLEGWPGCGCAPAPVPLRVL